MEGVRICQQSVYVYGLGEIILKLGRLAKRKEG